MPFIQLSHVTKALTIISLTALTVFSPNIQVFDFISKHDMHRMLELALLSLVLLDACIMGYLKPKSIIQINNKIRFALFALLILVGLSTYLSVNPRYGLIELSIFIALCYLSIFIAQLFISNKLSLIKQLCIVIWASIILYLVATYTGYLTATLVNKPLIWPRPLHGFTVIRSFSQFQLVSIAIICLPLLVFNLNKKLKTWCYIALACWWILLFYAAARGAVLAWLVAMLTTAVIFRKTAWPLLKIQLINFTTGFAGYITLFQLIPYLIAAKSETAAGPAVVARTMIRSTTQDRIDLWKASLTMIKDYPIFGVGPMQSYFHASLENGTHPHNSLLRFASEWGLPATIIIIMIAIYGGVCWFKRFNPQNLQTAGTFDRNLASTLFFSIIASAALSLVSGVTIMPFSQVWLFIIIGLMIGHYIESTPKKTAPSKRSYFRPALAVFALIALATTTWPEIKLGTTKGRALAQGQVPFSLAPNTINPRIWLQQRRPKNWLEEQNKKD